MGEPVPLELYRTDIGQRRVKHAMIIEAHPADHLVHRRSARCKAHAVQATYLQRSPQAFGRRVVQAVALATHRAAHSVGGQGSLEVRAAVLAAAVGMEDQPRRRMPPEPPHPQCIDHQRLFHVRLHRPAHDLPAKQIHHNSQVQPAFGLVDIGDVARPDAIRRARGELPPQEVRRHRQVVLRVGRHFVLLLSPRLDVMQRHQLSDPLLAYPESPRNQLQRLA